MDIKLDGLNLLRASLDGKERQINTAARRALNKTAAKGKTLLVQRITERRPLKKSYVRDKFRVLKATGDTLEARIVADRRGLLFRRLPMKAVFQGRFKNGKPRPAGFMVQVNRNEPAVHFKHVFMVPLRAGNRDGANGPSLAERAGKKRYPLKVLHTASPSQMFNRIKKETDFQQEIDAHLAKTFRHELQFELSKKSR